MKHAYFFGYGSLVNATTHDFTPVFTAKAKGWRRGWRYTPDRKVAYLTAIRDDSAEIDGLIAPVPDDNWEDLDHRERAYERHAAAHEITHEAEASEIAIYAIDPARMARPTQDHPILLSYLDVVIQGYLQVFGPEGVTHFAETTDGWHAPVLNDRESPIYPRARVLNNDERGMVDDMLARVGSQIFK
jgi:hypothetical protein